MAKLVLAKIAAKLKKSAFMRSIVFLLSGNIVSQVLLFLFAGILARLYSPSEYGVFGVFSSIAFTAGAVASLRYEQAIPIAVDHDAKTLRYWSFVFATGTSLLAGVAILIGTHLHAEYFHGLPMPAWICGTAAAVFLVAAANIESAVAIQRKSFRLLSVVGLIGTLFTVLAQCTCSQLSAGGLVIGSVIGLLVRFALLRAWQRSCFAASPATGSSRSVLIRFNDFPLFAAPQDAVNALSQHAPTLLLASLASPATAGAYAMTIRLMQRPMEMISSSVRSVFLQHASELQRERPAQLLPFFSTVTLGLAVLAAAPSTIVVLWGPTLFQRFLGDGWAEAGQYASWLILWLAVGFCNVPAVAIMRVKRAQGTMLVFQIVLLVSRCIALVAGCRLSGARGGIIAYSLIGAAFNFALILWALHLLYRARLADAFSNGPSCRTGRPDTTSIRDAAR